MEIRSEQPENKASRVLIVDDNPEIREIIHILLGGEGYDIEEAKNGNEAILKTKENTFDLIILDIMMPGMDGYHTCMEIRKESNAPILFLSAKTREGDKMLGFSSGGDDYLAKPFSYNELVSRAKALIRRYQVYKGKQERRQIPADGQEASSGKNTLRYTIWRLMKCRRRSHAMETRLI